MTVNVKQVPREDKSPKPIYPYKRLPHDTVTYRGYPCDGTQSMKKSGSWKIQLINPRAGSPPEPLPQFPQQERLRRVRKSIYSSYPPMSLSMKQTMYNSGEAYQVPGEPAPDSKYFFTAGYTPNSAIRLHKREKGSIYRQFVSGQVVRVAVESMDS